MVINSSVRNKHLRDQLTFLPKSHILLVRGIRANYLLPMHRQWIAHPKPRLICIDGIELHQQLAGIDELSHEVGAIIFRRFGQMDKFYNKDTATMIWRKFLEPDFAVRSLHTLSTHIQRQNTFLFIVNVKHYYHCNRPRYCLTLTH